MAADRFLAGSTALVTGGAVRLGRAIAIALAEAGASIALHYHHSSDEAEATIAEIAATGSDVCAFCADLQDSDAPSGIFSDAVERFGRVDLLVNSAAIFEPSNARSLTVDHWERHFAINLKAPAFFCSEFVKHLAGDARGQIINVADWRGLRSEPGHLAYTLTKSGMIALTRLLAVELAPRIRVNAIAPGAILPPPGASRAHLDHLAHSIPLRRTGSPEDVIGALLYLARSEFVTGEILCVTGGEHLV